MFIKRKCLIFSFIVIFSHAYAKAEIVSKLSFSATENCSRTLSGVNHAVDKMGETITFLVDNRSQLFLDSNLSEDPLALSMNGEMSNLIVNNKLISISRKEKSHLLTITEQSRTRFPHILDSVNTVNLDYLAEEDSFKVTWSKDEGDGWSSTTVCMFESKPESSTKMPERIASH